MSGYFVYHGSYQWVRLFVGGITILLITLGLSVAAVGSAAAQSTETVVSTDGDHISENISVTRDSIPNQDIAPTSTGSLTGDVVSEDGEYLTGAEVVLVDAETEQTVAEATTGSQGSYVFTDVELGEYQVTATFEDETGSTTITDMVEGTNNADVVVGLSESAGVLTGDIVNADNQNLPGAEVTVVDAETGQTVTETTASSDGSYTFSDIEQGDYQVTATFDGESGSRTTTVTDGTTTADIVIPGAELTGTLTGDVVNEDNAYLAGAEVTLVDAETDQTVTETLADEDGSYRFTDVTAGEYVVTATFEGETSSTAATVRGGETTVADIAIAGVSEPPALVAPDGFPADDETYSAIASVGEPNEDGTFGAITLAQAMNKMASEGTIDGVYIGQIQFAQIIHWHTNQ